MAQRTMTRSGERALPPGAVRRRIFFGLFDAQGWTWATLKAAFWFLFAWVSLGYLPDRAYYFTVLQTVDVNAFVGFERVLGLQQPPFFPIVNFCPPSNGSIECPAPPGGMTPWQTSPPELALPEARTGAAALQAGTHIFLAGGRGPDGAPVATIFVTNRLDLPLAQTGGVPIETGNLVPWTKGPDLPAARADMATTTFIGKLYLFGGTGPDGKPTDTVWVGVPDTKTGEVETWDAPADLAMPAPRSGSVAVALPTGLLVVGGSDGTNPTNSVFFNRFDTHAAGGGAFTGWVEEPAGLTLPEARTAATAYSAPGFVYVVGGAGPDGQPTRSVFRLDLSLCPGDPNANCDERDLPFQWASAPESFQLPGPRAGAAGLFVNGTMYVIGGRDQNGPVGTILWAIPETQDQFSKGNLRNGGWQHRNETDLRVARSGAGAAAVGSYAFLIGGAEEAAATNLERANLAPAPPFFRLGIAGITIPGLQIKGDLGNQLGLLAAFLVFGGSLTLLIVLGWAFHHRPQAWAFISWVTRGRIRNPYAGRT
jgi:hypothetical protein